ncbi:hypothetical protein [Arsenophonus endosymbiont of Bemisia tabaci]|uniref:hypothetical protein n=1 Tax=Arsenophonus endosymbiont of Bemisia tabaci TaxID=536059 RepID=UPI0015F455D6|nr:hypothetical protein [Arsenophonus endosymbiont of Bemisia tabaci]CAA2930546.1 hypothetical protein ARSQ2_01679 [Arsenophonus endosymbiont of Bemisia tabaci Q2]
MMDNATFHKKKSIQQVIIDAGIWWNICLPIRQILIQLNINGHCRRKKERSRRHRYFVRTQYGIIKIKSLSYTARYLWWRWYNRCCAQNHIYFFKSTSKLKVSTGRLLHQEIVILLKLTL